LFHYYPNEFIICLFASNKSKLGFTQVKQNTSNTPGGLNRLAQCPQPMPGTAAKLNQKPNHKGYHRELEL